MTLRTWDFSWSRTERRFRFRAAGDEVICNAIEGYAYIEGADGHTGHMQITARLEVTGHGQANLWLEPGDIESDVEVPEAVEYADTWQLCFYRREEKWRIWDKSNRASTLQIVDGYRGPAYISWFDGGGHIYVHGRKWDRDGVVYFAGDRPPIGAVRP